MTRFCFYLQKYYFHIWSNNDVHTFSHIVWDLRFWIFHMQVFWRGSFRHSEQLKVFLACTKIKYKACTIPLQGCLRNLHSCQWASLMTSDQLDNKQIDPFKKKKKHQCPYHMPVTQKAVGHHRALEFCVPPSFNLTNI